MDKQIGEVPALRLTTLAAFVYSLEAGPQDDVLKVLLGHLFSDAANADKKARLRTLKDLDEATAMLVLAYRRLLDPALADERIRAKVFESIPKETLGEALDPASALISATRRRLLQGAGPALWLGRRYLLEVLKHIAQEANPAGAPIVEACRWLRDNMYLFDTKDYSFADPAPFDVTGVAWQRSIIRDDRSINVRAYTFCTFDRQPPQSTAMY